MLIMKPLFPIRALQAPAPALWPEPTPADLIPPEPPVNDGPLGTGGTLAVVRWPDCRQWVSVLYEDALLDEAKVRYWVVEQGCAVAVEAWVPLARLEGRR